MFENRRDAGRILAGMISGKNNLKNSIVLALPRGGIAVAEEICRLCGIPIGILPVKKIGHPQNPEYALGAVTDSVEYLEKIIIEQLGVSIEYISKEIKKRKNEIKQFKNLLNLNYQLPIENFRNIIVTDDGVATGSTIIAAIKHIKFHISQLKNPQKMIIAVPVIAKQIYNILLPEADKIIPVKIVENLNTVGAFYKDFSQVSESEVRRIYDTYSRIGKSRG